MVIAVAGGKGGCGKTTVAVSLALALRARGQTVQLLDCDVEEPNCHLFLHPTIQHDSPATLPVPRIDDELCDRCGRCAQVCAFGALVSLKDGVTVFPELCHGCGACVVVCPRDAISEELRTIGRVTEGKVAEDPGAGIDFVGGTLDVSESLAPPVVKAVIKRIRPRAEKTNPDECISILDVSPGTSCPVVEALGAADYVVLVAESTPFGLHDLTLIAELVQELGLPTGIVWNRVGLGDDRLRNFAIQRGIPLLAEIPDNLEVARQQARGRPAYFTNPAIATMFDELATNLQRRVQQCAS